MTDAVANAMIAERVEGWEPDDFAKLDVAKGLRPAFHPTETGEGTEFAPNYRTDAAAQMRAFEALRERGYTAMIESEDNGSWTVFLGIMGDEYPECGATRGGPTELEARYLALVAVAEGMDDA